jgi:hypothetical protein
VSGVKIASVPADAAAAATLGCIMVQASKASTSFSYEHHLISYPRPSLRCYFGHSRIAQSHAWQSCSRIVLWLYALHPERSHVAEPVLLQAF